MFQAIRPMKYFESDLKNSPVAVRLSLGCVLGGPLPSSSGLIATCFKANTDPDSLPAQLRAWDGIESFGAMKQVDPRLTANKRALEILNETTYHDGTRYQVGMLWANDDALPDNYYAAFVQLKSLEKRLEKDPILKNRYRETISSYINDGYIIEVSPYDPTKRSRCEWYLPHHPVVNPNKPAKVTRVLNGAAKFQKALLNNSLLTGADLLQNLMHTLLRFHEHKFAVSADFEGMFLQVRVLEQDQPSIRFLWRDAPNDDIVVYPYVRHIFGAKDSPTCANYALQRTAADNAVSFADAARAATLKIYMDDFLDSLPTTELALRKV